MANKKWQRRGEKGVKLSLFFWLLVGEFLLTSCIVHSLFRLDIILVVDDFQANVLLQVWCARNVAPILKVECIYLLKVIPVVVLFICFTCIVSNKNCCSSAVDVIESKTLEHSLKIYIDFVTWGVPCAGDKPRRLE